MLRSGMVLSSVPTWRFAPDNHALSGMIYILVSDGQGLGIGMYEAYTATQQNQVLILDIDLRRPTFFLHVENERVQEDMQLTSLHGVIRKGHMHAIGWASSVNTGTDCAGPGQVDGKGQYACAAATGQ